jgi:hypothetical protein
VSVTEKETTEPRRWSAFVCPDCRFIFRLPGVHDGEGVVCPSCRRLLRLPGEDEESAPLMAPPDMTGFAEDGTPVRHGERRSRSKRRKKPNERETPDWDVRAGTWRSSRKKGKRTARMFARWSLAIAVIFGAAFLIMRPAEPKERTENASTVDDYGEPAQVPLLHPDEELEEPIELPKIMRRSESEFLSLAQPMAEAFLTATSIEQILPLVRDRERVRPHILARYPDGKIEPGGLYKFNVAGQVTYKDSFAAVSVQTGDFQRKQLAFVDSAEGLKIDWESWVGWSELPWDKLIESRPTRPVVVRAILKWMDYYNFGFTDESKWRSYHIVSPDGEHTLYGYAERNSLLDQRLRPPEQKASVAVTLKIRFPEEGENRNQALIVEYLSDGWVLPEEAE